MIRIPGSTPIYIHPFFWLSSALIASLSTLDPYEIIIWVQVILLSLFVHEWGHAFFARLFGQKTEIHLLAFGGMTYRKGKTLSTFKELVVIAAGPVFGLSLALFLRVLISMVELKLPLLVLAVNVGVLINLFWSLFNLLPLLPLDGGQLCKTLAKAFFGVTGVKLVIISSIGLSICLSYYMASKQFYLFFLFLFIALENVRDLRFYRSLTDSDFQPDLQERLQKALLDDDEDRQLVALIDLRKELKGGAAYQIASVHLAAILEKRAEYSQALSLLSPLKKDLSLDGLAILQRLAFFNEEDKLVIESGQKIFSLKSDAESAFLNASSHARRGELEASLGWLKAAYEHGYGDVYEAIQKEKSFLSFLQRADFMQEVRKLSPDS